MLEILVCLAALGAAVIGQPLEVKSGEDSRIVGGVEAPKGYATHMAALVWGDTVKSLMCGGSIVSKRYILTAAHCIDPMILWGELIPSFHAVVGSKRWDSRTTEARISGYVIHPDYDWRNLKNDIGLLSLTEDLKLDSKVTIIALNFDWIEGNESSYATGWGRLGSWHPIPDNLQLLYVNTISIEQCAQGIRDASEWWGTSPPFDPFIELCTLHSYGHGMCNGDSGSALVSRKTGTQIGIVSWGFPCARGAPDVFVRLSAYKDFLLPYLGQSQNGSRRRASLGSLKAFA